MSADASCFSCMNAGGMQPPDELPLMGGFSSTVAPMTTQQLQYIGSSKASEYMGPTRGVSRCGASPAYICNIVGAIFAAVGVAVIFYFGFSEPWHVATAPEQPVSAANFKFSPDDCIGSDWLKWTQARREYCYTVVKHKDQPAKPAPPPKPDVYDCEAGHSNWRLGWSPAKKDWCCKEKGKGCADEVCVTKGCDDVCHYDVSGQPGHVSCRERVTWAQHNSKHVSGGNLLGAISLVKDECRCQCACSLDDFEVEDKEHDGRQG